MAKSKIHRIDSLEEAIAYVMDRLRVTIENLDVVISRNDNDEYLLASQDWDSLRTIGVTPETIRPKYDVIGDYLMDVREHMIEDLKDLMEAVNASEHL